MSGRTVLVVDDEDAVRFGIKTFLEAHGYGVAEAASCAEAEAAFSALPPDAVILDLNLPDGSGTDLFPRLKQAAPEVPFIILTGHGSIEAAVKAIKQGAEQFLTKPVELPALLVLLARLLQSQRDHRSRLAGNSQKARDGIDPFTGASPALKRLAEDCQRLRASESPILIQGETGSGKGVLARWLHAQGPRADEALVELNCAAFTKELLDTELFGHERGAFTGAASAKPGLLEVAHRGTVFLDEIGDMDLAVQPKLLKALEDKRIRRVGEVRERHVDFRLIAATHQDLGRLSREGRFRSDLYYRINALTLFVPPLRERAEDIPLLARQFLERSAREAGRPRVVLAREALAGLQAHSWPGNVRELRNVLERALLVCDHDVIEVQDLRFSLGGPPEPSLADAPLNLDELELRAIETALRVEHGKVENAARRLGISRSALYLKIKKLGLRASRI